MASTTIATRWSSPNLFWGKNIKQISMTVLQSIQRFASEWFGLRTRLSQEEILAGSHLEEASILASLFPATENNTALIPVDLTQLGLRRIHLSREDAEALFQHLAMALRQSNQPMTPVNEAMFQTQPQARNRLFRLKRSIGMSNPIRSKETEYRHSETSDSVTQSTEVLAIEALSAASDYQSTLPGLTLDLNPRNRSLTLKAIRSEFLSVNGASSVLPKPEELDLTVPALTCTGNPDAHKEPVGTPTGANQPSPGSLITSVRKDETVKPKTPALPKEKLTPGTNPLQDPTTQAMRKATHSTRHLINHLAEQYFARLDAETE